MANNLKKIILESFEELQKQNVETLLENRYTKFRSIGKFI
ncbi:MAG: hypothetical protein ACRC7W_06985 [Fusobacteriaceae bacterium]